MLYTLVLVTALIPSSGYANSGGNVSSSSIHGFTTEQACINAGKKIMIPGNGDYHKTVATFTCVKMDV